MNESGAPASIEAERSILGAILLENIAFYECLGDLTAQDFSLDSHQRIFSCMNEIFSGEVEGITHVDLVTLSAELSRRSADGGRTRDIDRVGGASYLASLIEGLPRRLSIEEYVNIVRDKAKLRRMINIFSQAITKASDQSETASTIRERVEAGFIKEDADEKGKFVHIGEVAPTVEKQINKQRNISSEHVALDMTWGIPELDDFTKGAFGGELTVLGAETSGGKSVFGMQITLANARAGLPCAWFSIEMTKEKLVRRYFPAMGDIITASHVRDPRLMNLETHVPELDRLRKELAKLPILIDETSPIDITKLRARIRVMRKKHGTRLFVIDYLQLIRNPIPHSSRAEQVEGIMFSLRELMKVEPDIHVLLLSQFSRANKFMRKKGGSRREKDDLMGSSAIEHAAQNVLLLRIESPEEKEKDDLLKVEFTFDKQREGKIGRVESYYDRDHLRFTQPQPPMRY